MVLMECTREMERFYAASDVHTLISVHHRCPIFSWNDKVHVCVHWHVHACFVSTQCKSTAGRWLVWTITRVRLLGCAMQLILVDDKSVPFMTLET